MAYEEQSQDLFADPSIYSLFCGVVSKGRCNTHPR